VAKYVDGFLLPMPKKALAGYRRIATRAGKIWKKHGALDYFECAGDDLKPQGTTANFRKVSRAKPSETVIFAFVVYKSKAHRNAVNKKVFKDPELAKMMETMSYDMGRMAYGGFKVIVEE
jgi:uncharacterized protein YbaA (DUF1428 family)